LVNINIKKTLRNVFPLIGVLLYVIKIGHAAAPSVHYTTSCKHNLVLLRMGEIIARNMLS